MKNAKSPGSDDVLNEYIKCTSHLLMPLYTLLFNVILETRIMLSKWVEGVVIPIFKNKGDPLSVDNYRPITLLSCISKLFTAVLNNRLNAYLEEYNLLNENQAGFRSGNTQRQIIFSHLIVLSIYSEHKRKRHSVALLIS